MFIDFFENLVKDHNFFLSPIGLFIMAFIEASFSPIPPDIFLIPLCIIDPENAILYGIIATSASVLGALLGYGIGLKGGRPLIRRFVRPSLIDGAESYFNKYGAWAIGLAAITPIPFKVFTITSGALRFKNISKFILASAIGRAGRFLPEAIFLMLYGRSILNFIQSTFQVLVILIAVVFFSILLFIKKSGFKLNVKYF